VDRLADLASRRPRALLAGNLGALAAAVILAAGAPSHLGIGSLSVGETGKGTDLVVATTGEVPVHSGVYRVALRVISSQIRSDPGVADLSQGPISGNGRSTSLLVTMAPEDDADRQAAVEQIKGEIDPGPLTIAYGGDVAVLDAARDDLSGDLWKLELLAVPFTLLVLGGSLGARLALAPVICATMAIAGSLAGLRLAGAVADVSLYGIAPAAVVGLVLGLEAPCLFLARFRDEAALAPPAEAVRRTLAGGGPAVLLLGFATTAATAGLLATSLDQAPSVVFACALAAFLAVGSTLVCVPALLTLTGAPAGAGSAISSESRLARPARVLGGFLARSRLRTLAAALVAIALMLTAASPLLDGKTRPFSAADLPAGTQARNATAIATGDLGRPERPHSQSGARVQPGPHAEGSSLFAKLALAGGISAVALIIVFVATFRTARVVPVAAVTLLPAAAACGLCVLVFQEGHLAAAVNQQRQGALETGAAAALLCALAAVSAFRAAVAIRTAREERSLGLPAGRAGETATAFTLPAATVATVIGAAAAGVLAGSDLYPAREFGLAVAAGLTIDLLLLRVPLISALARWGGG